MWLPIRIHTNSSYGWSLAPPKGPRACPTWGWGERRHTLQRLEARSRGSVAGHRWTVQGFKDAIVKPRPGAVSNRPTVTPLSRAHILHSTHPSASARQFRLQFNGLVRSELRRIFCCDEGALMRILQCAFCTRRIRQHPPEFRLPFPQSELRRIFCSDEGALMRISRHARRG